MKKLKRIEVYKSESFNLGYDAPDNLKEFMKFLEDIKNTIPDEYQDTAEIDLESVQDGYGAAWIEAVIYYDRPETEDEEMERINREQRRQRDIEDREMQEYNRLKAKFEKES